MAEEVIIILVSIKDGSLNIQINSQDAIQLWGLAKIIEISKTTLPTIIHLYCKNTLSYETRT